MDSIRILFDERVLDLTFDEKTNCVKIIIDSDKVSIPFYFSEMDMLLESFSDKYLEISFGKR